jgi:hypothetical protein
MTKLLKGEKKMKKTIGLAVITASVFFAPCAMAEKGMWEMSVAGNIEKSTNKVKVTGFADTSSDTTNTFINVDVGRYFTSRLVGRVNLSTFGTETSTSKSLGTALGVGVKYYFGESAKSAWVPFVQGGINVVAQENKSTAGGTTTTTNLGGMGFVGGGGVSYFLSEDVSADVALQLFYNSLTSSAFDMTQSGTRLLFGLTGRF